MDENQKPNEITESNEEPQIVVNDYGTTKDSTVVVEEETRTVLLTDDETIIFEKEPRIDIVPKNRPRKVYGGMWGPTEIATVGLGMLAILTTILLFVFLVLPAKKELEANKQERDRIETELTSAKRKYGDITDTETQVARLLGSVNEFEARFLRNPVLDKTSLYQRINGLISAYGLVNTTGPDYTPLEISDNRKEQETESERGRAKFQSLFPGVYVTTTIEGSYQNLRRFIRQIETSEQFVVISAIELEPAENEEENNPATPTQASISQVQINPMNPGEVAQNPTFTQTVPLNEQPKIVRGKTRGETVSLRLEMAAYFRRPIVQPTQISTQQ
jgi:hypothetical protein